MTDSGTQTPSDWIDPDDAPDLSTSEWLAKISAVPLKSQQAKRSPVDNEPATNTSSEDHSDDA